MNKAYRALAGFGAAAATALIMSATATAEVSTQAPVLYAGPDGANIRETASASGELVRHVPAGTAFNTIECRLKNGAGNYWYRLNSLPDPTYVYSGNLTSAPGIPNC